VYVRPRLDAELIGLSFPRRPRIARRRSPGCVRLPRAAAHDVAGRAAPGPERYRRDVDDHLVEESGVRELAGEVTASDDPDVPLAYCFAHGLVDCGHVRRRELDPCAGDDRRLAVREDPARNVVRPLPLDGILARELVVEDPLVGRRAHRQRSDTGDENVVVE